MRRMSSSTTYDSDISSNELFGGCCSLLLTSFSHMTDLCDDRPTCPSSLITTTCRHPLTHSFWRPIQTFTPLLLHYTPADLAWIRKAIVQCDPEQWGHSTDWWSVHTENWSSYSSAKMDNTIAWMRHVINTYQSVQLSILTVAMNGDERWGIGHVGGDYYGDWISIGLDWTWLFYAWLHNREL